MYPKLLELKNISKDFGPTKALSNISFTLERGEVHCLVGENGAGKSTLIKILAGIHGQDSGEIFIDGGQAEIKSPNASKHLGISVVHQELMLCADLTVAENIFLGKEDMRGGFLDKKAQLKRAVKILNNIDHFIDADAVVNTLSTAKRQVTEIARAVSAGARIVIFDEPTSSLSNEEAEKLFTIILGLRDEGIGIIYISHRLEEIFRIASRVTVLRDGYSIGTLTGTEINRDAIITMMVGRELKNFYIRNNSPMDKVLFEAENVSGGPIQNISFYVREGEILGFAGLIGAGRTELMHLIFGIDHRTGGSFTMAGQNVRIRNTGEAIRCGITLVPEDRKLQGLFLEKGIAFNMSICSLKDIIRRLRVNTKFERELIEKYGGAMKLKMAHYDQEVRALSGGNQQKVLIGRWLAVAEKVLIMDEPTKGIDVGSKADIYQIIDELAGRGYGIIIVSSELQEIIGMCDRVYVMHDFTIAGCLEKENLNQVAIMNYAMGGKSG
jgi:ABC-type sugar transport system ATPase subunit